MSKQEEWRTRCPECDSDNVFFFEGKPVSCSNCGYRGMKWAKTVGVGVGHELR